MTEIAPIERPSTSDRVAAEVRRLVWTGELTAGARLNQDDLAQRFGVSRIPVREALIALAHAGVISMTPHRGAFVEPLTAEAVSDLYDLYARIDGFAIAKAVVSKKPPWRRPGRYGVCADVVAVLNPEWTRKPELALDFRTRCSLLVECDIVDLQNALSNSR